MLLYSIIQVLQCYSSSVVVELLQYLEKIISSHVVHLELKILTLPLPSYRWTRNSGSGQTQVGANSNTLSFTPLRLADAASYVCGVTVSSSYLASDITAINSFDIRVQCE